MEIAKNTLPLIRHSSFIWFCLFLFGLLFMLANSNSINLQNIFDEKPLDLRLIIMFLLAEPHFAMTIPLLYGYREQFVTHKNQFTYIPLAIIFVAIAMFILSPVMFGIIFLLVNIYHVNRQSRGILMMQVRVKLNIATLYERTLHCFVVLVFVVRFVDFEYEKLIVTLLIIAAVITSAIIAYRAESPSQFITKFICLLQGFAIFAPIAFFDDLLLAFAVGISIHYLQYIVISYPVCIKAFKISLISLIAFLVLYTILSTSILGGFIVSDRTSLIILIPTVLQLLHFYYDGIIWRRSSSEIREKLVEAGL